MREDRSAPPGEEGATRFEDAQAHYRAGEYEAAAKAYERAFLGLQVQGEMLGAAAAARMLAWVHGNVLGNWAVANGWLARAAGHLDAAGDDGPERGWVELLRATCDDDPVSRQRRFREARAIGRRFADADLEFEAASWVGVELVVSDRVEEGMVLLDEAMAAVASGEVSDYCVVEGVMCGMFFACERTYDVARADQWVRAVAEVVERRSLAAVGAFCKAHYGAILTAAGRWDEADAELTAAARMFAGGSTRMEANALVRLADLRVRQGRIEEAALLVEMVSQHPDAARPLAAVHLARGRAALARDVVEGAVPAEGGGPAIGPLLALLVDVHLAEGGVEEARAAADRLAQLAQRSPSHYLRAAAALARGKVCVALGDGAARSCFQDALSLFSLAQMPAELARARLELAKALASQRPEVAIAEASDALAAFERLEAARDADAAAALLRQLGAHGRTGRRTGAPLSTREREVLELLAHGLSNPDIADRLFLSRKTVEHHVSRILAKLNCRTRAQAAAHAARTSVHREKG